MRTIRMSEVDAGALWESVVSAPVAVMNEDGVEVAIVLNPVDYLRLLRGLPPIETGRPEPGFAAEILAGLDVDALMSIDSAENFEP